MTENTARKPRLLIVDDDQLITETLGFVLGDSLEANFRRTLILSDGDWTSFVRSPLAVVLLLAALALLIVTLLPKARHRRDEIFQDP